MTLRSLEVSKEEKMSDSKKRRLEKKNLQMLNTSELMKRCRLYRAGIMFVINLISDALTSPTQQ